MSFSNAMARLFSADAMMSAIKRFPVPLFWCVVSALLWESVKFDLLTQSIERWAMGAFWALISSLAVTFWADGRGRASSQSHLLALVVSLALYFAGYAITNIDAVEPAIMLSVLLFGLALIAPFSLRAESNSKLNLWLCHGVTLFIFSMVGTGLLLGGVALVLWAIEALFEVDLNISTILDHLYILTYTLLTPLFFFQHLPRIQELSEDDFKTKHPYWFLLVYVVLPLWVIYLGVLYAYFGKIALEQTLPKNILSGMIIGLSLVGLYIHTSLYLRAESGKWHERAFYRYFYPAMALPLGMLIYAIYLRVSDYGWTGERVLVAMVAVIVGCGLAQYLIVGWRKLSLTAVIASWLIIPALLSIPAFTPSEISIKSQIAQFESAFAQRKTLPNKDNSEATRLEGRMSSALDYLQKNKAMERLKKTMDTPSQALVGELTDAGSVMKALGFAYINTLEKRLNNQLRYSQRTASAPIPSDALDITYKRVNFYNKNMLEPKENKIYTSEKTLAIKLDENHTLTFDLSAVFEKAEAITLRNLENTDAPVWVSEKDGRLSAQLMLDYMNIEKNNAGLMEITNFDGFVLYKTPASAPKTPQKK